MDENSSVAGIVIALFVFLIIIFIVVYILYIRPSPPDPITINNVPIQNNTSSFATDISNMQNNTNINTNILGCNCGECNNHNINLSYSESEEDTDSIDDSDIDNNESTLSRSAHNTSENENININNDHLSEDTSYDISNSIHKSLCNNDNKKNDNSNDSDESLLIENLEEITDKEQKPNKNDKNKNKCTDRTIKYNKYNVSNNVSNESNSSDANNASSRTDSIISDNTEEITLSYSSETRSGGDGKSCMWICRHNFIDSKDTNNLKMTIPIYGYFNSYNGEYPIINAVAINSKKGFDIIYIHITNKDFSGIYGLNTGDKNPSWVSLIATGKSKNKAIIKEKNMDKDNITNITSIYYRDDVLYIVTPSGIYTLKNNEDLKKISTKGVLNRDHYGISTISIYNDGHIYEKGNKIGLPKGYIVSKGSPIKFLNTEDYMFLIEKNNIKELATKNISSKNGAMVEILDTAVAFDANVDGLICSVSEDGYVKYKYDTDKYFKKINNSIVIRDNIKVLISKNNIYIFST